MDFGTKDFFCEIAVWMQTTFLIALSAVNHFESGFSFTLLGTLDCNFAFLLQPGCQFFSLFAFAALNELEEK